MTFQNGGGFPAFPIYEPGTLHMGDAVRWMRGRFPVKAAAEIAAITGDAPASIYNYLDLRTVPNGSALTRLFTAFGPAFMAASMRNPPHWILDAVADEQHRKLQTAKAAIDRQIQTARFK